MLRNELYEQIDDLFNQVCGIELYAVLKKGMDKEIRFMNICDEEKKEDNTSDSLQEGFMDSVRMLLCCEDEEQAILKLSTADDRKDAIYYYDLDELPYEMQLLYDVTNPIQDFKKFDFQNDSLNEIIGFIVAIGNANNHVVIYKQQYPISLLRHDKFMLTPLFDRNRFEKYNGDILRIDFNCQFLLFNDITYILDVDKMEKICSFTNIIRNEAEKSIEKIKEIDIVDNIDTLTDELDNMTFARKLTRVYKDSKVIGKVNNEKIILFSKTHTYFIKNPIRLNEGGDKFILDTKKAKNAFLKLLNDDLLTSELTKAEYESVAKNDA